MHAKYLFAIIQVSKGVHFIGNVFSNCSRLLFCLIRSYLERHRCFMIQYSKDEVMQFVNEEDVKFIRLAFCDVFGKQKNVSIMPSELPRAFMHGIAIDSSSICGFDTGIHSDLFLHPDPNTLAILPWRPEHGRVIRMFCRITYPDGQVFENDTRSILIRAIKKAETLGLKFSFGSELEFYLFKTDEEGLPTKVPYDNAAYMDISPDDKGENVRREICLTLEKMGIQPESSHHEEGPGQNEIDFRYSDALSAADNAITFKNVVTTISARNGLYADFSPKPLKDKPGSGFHINMSVKGSDDEPYLDYVIAGIIDKITDMTLFLNPVSESYERLGHNKAPKYVSWSKENRSQLIRIPAAFGEYVRAELRSADPMANPYITFALLIEAAIEGVEKKMQLPPAIDIDLFSEPNDHLKDIPRLPSSLEEAKSVALESNFINKYIPENILKNYCK